MAEQEASQPRITVLLVDDQAMMGEAVRRVLASCTDIEFHYCQDPTQALATAAELQPTVILQDLVMPGVDGLDLVSEYRQQDATRDTPLIVLSTKEEADTKARAFANGANDYLVKFPEPLEMVARIRYHSRGYIALLERNAAHEALAANEQAMRKELNKAAHYVRSLLPPPMTAPMKTDWRFIPSASLGGDAFDYHWLDDDHFMMCLVDACGHGVGSALLSVSAINVLRSRTLPDTDFKDPTRVLEGLNAAFQMEQHNSMFFTMWYGVLNTKTRELRWGGAGHPPALVIPTGGGTILELKSQSMMVGVELDSEFPSESCIIEPGAELYIYSDGVYEITKSDGEIWTYGEFLEVMGPPVDPGTSRMDRLLEHGRVLQGSDLFVDDFSIIQVDL